MLIVLSLCMYVCACVCVIKLIVACHIRQPSFTWAIMSSHGQNHKIPHEAMRRRHSRTRLKAKKKKQTEKKLRWTAFNFAWPYHTGLIGQLTHRTSLFKIRILCGGILLDVPFYYFSTGRRNRHGSGFVGAKCWILFPQE